MSKAAFFYCTGTAYTFSVFGTALQLAGTGRWFWGDREINPTANPVTNYVRGLNGTVFPWPDGVMNDPFPFMLDLDAWEPERVNFASAFLGVIGTGGAVVGGMGASINDGIEKVIARINALPPGKPFALGGQSQGAAVMSGVYNELRYGSLTSRYPSFLGAVCFGNPRRQVNHRGEIGGTWSGAWDVPGSDTGGHGSFPADGPWARLQNCDGNEWIEFANPNDVITSTGDSPLGLAWTEGNRALLDFTPEQLSNILIQGLLSPFIPSALINGITAAMNGPGAIVNYLIDAAGQQGGIGGGGHTLYPALAPYNASTGYSSVSKLVRTDFTETAPPVSSVAGVSNKAGRSPAGAGPTSITHEYLQPAPGSETCYQMALKWLNSKAKAYATAPLVIPSEGQVGWSTTLIPPGAVDSKKPRFYWANGTSWFTEIAGEGWNFQPPPQGVMWLKGLNGELINSEGGEHYDPFPLLLDSTKWQIQRVLYPATITNGYSSIKAGVKFIVNDILTKPAGTKFAVGGFSQGGAVTHLLIKETRPGGLLESRANDLVAAVTFGAPTRELNHSFPGSSGYSGTLGGAVTGGHGAFPPEIRISNTPSWCWDFTMPYEISSGIGDSTWEQLMSASVGASLYAPGPLLQLAGLAASVVFGKLTGALDNPAATNTVYDALTGAPFTFQGSGGHPLYPHYPPPRADGTFPSSGPTVYQIAAQYLMDVVNSL